MKLRLFLFFLLVLDVVGLLLLGWALCTRWPADVVRPLFGSVVLSVACTVLAGYVWLLERPCE